MKRIVRLKQKDNGEIFSYPTITDLFQRNGEETLGISLNALYNALSKNNSRWENKQFEIYYETVDLGNKQWK